MRDEVHAGDIIYSPTNIPGLPSRTSEYEVLNPANLDTTYWT